MVQSNCVYYWGFAAWLAYYINHPLYTPPSYGAIQVNYAVAMFAVCEVGNFSINLALSNLKAEGCRSRMIPYPSKNPFTWLFFFVSCPNYTYEASGSLAEFHSHDPMCSSGPVHMPGLHSDDDLGERKAQNLHQRVQGLPTLQDVHHSLFSLKKGQGYHAVCPHQRAEG
ncbi:hypothetical protein GJAV_G00082750 [Gymnothorax javanicus]|nr:hypothetical protein GJAV_G00082750 [Gymnothorax javanicus]